MMTSSTTAGAPLVGARAFVTGGSSDIGRAVCALLAARGADVCLGYFSDHAGADETKAQIEAAGRRAFVVRAHFGEDGAAARAAEQAVAHLGGAVDIFVHAAASGTVRAIVGDAGVKDKHARWSFDINALSFLSIARVLVGGGMADGGRIVALSSLGAARAIPHYAAIGASKAALEALVRNVAVEAGPRGITVNAVSPGFVDTRALAHFDNKDELREQAVRRTSLGRLVTPDDVARTVAFLCSRDAAMIHGVTLHVDGGYQSIA